MSSVYVTPTGFVKKTLAEIKTELEVNCQAIWGNDIDLSADQPFGQLIGELSKDFADMWDALEEVYSSRNPDQAIGISLDNIVTENGITRLVATPTTVRDVMLFGDNGTIILTGKKAKQVSNTINYGLDSTVTISKDIARYGSISVTTVTIGNTYTVIINSVSYSYTAIGGDTKTSILTALKALIDAGISGVSTAITTDPLLTLTKLSENFVFDISGQLKIEEVGSVGDFTAEITGANSLPANSLTEIVTSVTGWNSVNNYSVGLTGSATETDDALRIRREVSILNGSATDQAIQEAIINNVANVTSCTVTSNRTDSIDIEGRPAHSFEAIVNGGTDEDIAYMILAKQGAGCASYGNVTVIVVDSQGTEQPISFSRAIPKYIWVRVSRDFYTEEIYPVDGDAQIKTAINTWALNTANISAGKDIIRQRLSIPIYSVPGIKDIVIEIAKTDNPGDIPTYAEADISLNAREVGIFSIDRIVVQDI